MKYIVRYYTFSKYLNFKRMHEKEFKTAGEMMIFVFENNLKDVEIYQKITYNVIKEGDKNA